MFFASLERERERVGVCVCVWVCEREKEKDKKEQNCLDEKINEETEWVERPTEITSRIV